MSSTPNGKASDLLRAFLQDSSVTSEDKADCLKLLCIIVKNLTATPVDEKHCKLKLDNAKVQKRLVPYSDAMLFLESIGFTKVDNELLILQPELVDTTAMESCFLQVSNGVKELQQQQQQQKQSSSWMNEKPRGKLTEKQKQRLLMEEKEMQERKRDRAARKRNLAMLKQDKYVRENDENWESGASAACTKSGDGISTFRDKYGEH